MNAEGVLAHFEKIADAPDAIARLRRFILDLAVRGKLVPQDPNDEPASELLVKIRAARKALGLREIISPPEIDNTPFDLPLGWSWARIGAICSKTGSGSTPRGGKEVYKSVGVPFLRSQNVYDDGLRLEDVAFIDESTHERMSGTHVKPGDLLLNITGGSMGRCSLVPDSVGEANISQHVAIIRVAIRGVEPFLHSLVLSPYFQAFVFQEQTGAGRGGLPKNRMDQIAVALPPLAEQHRIVAKVAELMALCDRLEAARELREETRSRLSAASLARLSAPAPETFKADARFALDALPALTTRPDQIKALRQTILNLAVRGKLVPQVPSDEPASELLRRLAKERARLRHDGGLDELTSGAQIREEALPIQIPNTWAWARLCDVGHLSGGMTPSMSRSDYWNGGVVWLSPKDIKADEVYSSELTISPLGLHETRLKLYRPGCLFMVARSGILKRTFPVAINRVPAAANQDLKVLNPLLDGQERYLQIMFRGLTDFLLRELVKTGTTVQSLKYAEFEQQPFPLPPLAEQHRIVAKVDELMALCDRLEESLAAAEAARRSLLEALLAEALTPLDARELEAAE